MLNNFYLNKPNIETGKRTNIIRKGCYSEIVAFFALNELSKKASSYKLKKDCFIDVDIQLMVERIDKGEL